MVRVRTRRWLVEDVTEAANGESPHVRLAYQLPSPSAYNSFRTTTRPPASVIRPPPPRTLSAIGDIARAGRGAVWSFPCIIREVDNSERERLEI